MTSKTVTIHIDPVKHGQMKDEGYKMCFAKKVGEDFDVVWQSSTDYLATNTFRWVPAYQLFGSNNFLGGAAVSVQTEIVDIGLGETLTLNPEGDIIGPAITGGPADSVTLINNFGRIHPGLNSVSILNNGGRLTTPIYVAKDAIETGTVHLTPVDIVRVWFAQDVATSTMISKDVSQSIDIDMTSTDTAARLFDDHGNWKTVASPTARAADPRSYLIMTVAGIGAVAAGVLAGKITSLLTGVYSRFRVNVSSPAIGSLTISYSDRPGSAGQAALIRQDVTTVDYLVELTMQGLELCGVGFTSVTAKVPA
jgi:hypothetical protein